MLQQLTVRDYAIVELLDMDFRNGMSVITGETGAGKSIILGALGLTLGDRADTSVVRTGCARTDIHARFDLTGNSRAQQWLKQHDLEGGDADANDCLLRRLVNADGGSRAYINGSPVNLASLTELGDMLMDIHSQHEHQSLLRRSTHQRLLDEYGVNAALLVEMHRCWQSWHENRQRIRRLTDQSEERNAQLELLGFQLQELDDLAPAADENAELEQEFQLLNNADSSRETLQQVLAICEEDEDFNMRHALARAQSLVTPLAAKNPALKSVADLLATATIQIEEATAELQQTLEHINIDPQRLEAINSRLADLHRLARKHKVLPGELHELHRSLQREYDSYHNSDQDLDSLQQAENRLQEKYQVLAQQVSQQRQQAAQALTTRINKQLSTLGMAEARLEVSLTPTAQSTPAATGLESVEFLVSTNPGQPPKALARVASGGELSRISLAIQVVTAQTSKVPTLVFDEVDVGIGGGVAKSVGQLLRKLSAHTQIICVTHQAQVASQGQQHYFVSKQTKNNITSASIEELRGDTKVREVARMLGGEEFTDASLAHAKQLVANQ